MGGLNYIEKIQHKIKEAKALKEYGKILAKIYRDAVMYKDTKKAEEYMKHMNDTRELLDNLDVYGSDENRERTMEEIGDMLDK